MMTTRTASGTRPARPASTAHQDLFKSLAAPNPMTTVANNFPARQPAPTSSRQCVTLVTRGVPPGQPLLAAGSKWVRSTERPDVAGSPHFEAVTDGENDLHLFMGARGWQIAPEVDSGVAYAIAPGVPAAHPNTIRPGEWQLPIGPDGAWVADPDFHVGAEGPNTEERPFKLDEIGADFFLRIKTTKLVWFVDPTTGEVLHSGAKNAGSMGRPGKRYCPLCSHCFSANNFVSQHLKNLHTPPAPSMPTVVPDGEDGTLLWWKADGCPPLAQPSSFAVQYSEDGGATWEMALSSTGSAEPRARIASLRYGVNYVFRVATIALATTGPYSPQSLPFQLGMETAADLAVECEGADGAGSPGSKSPVAPPAFAWSPSQYAAPKAVVARMDAALDQLQPLPPATYVGGQATKSPTRPAPLNLKRKASFASVFCSSPVGRSPALERGPVGPGHLLLSHKQARRESFSNSLPIDLQEYLDGEIENALAQYMSDDFLDKVTEGDMHEHVELKLSIPVSKLTSSRPLAPSPATSSTAEVIGAGDFLGGSKDFQFSPTPTPPLSPLPSPFAQHAAQQASTVAPAPFFSFARASAVEPGLPSPSSPSGPPSLWGSSANAPVRATVLAAPSPPPVAGRSMTSPLP